MLAENNWDPECTKERQVFDEKGTEALAIIGMSSCQHQMKLFHTAKMQTDEWNHGTYWIPGKALPINQCLLIEKSEGTV